jgi:hypothetical protein
MVTERPRHVAVFSHPRTASNLILKILNIAEQPNVFTQPVMPDHHFTPAIKVEFNDNGCVKGICELSEEKRKAMIEHYGKNLHTLDEYATRAASEGKIAFFREHCISLSDPVAQYCFYSGASIEGEEAWSIPSRGEDEKGRRTPLNRTVLSDAFLRQWFPIFVIRHPISAFSSYSRVLIKSESSEAKTQQQATMVNTYHWTRSLYDCYKYSFGINGIILDADDIMKNPQLLVNMSKSIGLDASKLKFTWAATQSAEEIAAKATHDPQHLEFMETLDRSTGIVKNKMRSSVELEKEKEKWVEEFGQEHSLKLEEWVAAAMEDYMYLMRNKFIE